MALTTDYYLEHAQTFGWGQPEMVVDQERSKLLREFIKGQKILDIGCGLGVYTNHLAKLGYTVTGCDFVKEFIERSRRERAGNYVIANATKLPFKDKAFETVLLFDILEHGDDLKILKEASRVCKNRLLIIVPKKADIALEQNGLVFRHYIDKTHMREYQSDGLKTLARRANLKIKLIKPVHPIINENVFWILFKGESVIKKVIRKLAFLVLSKNTYHSELLAVLER